MSSFESSRSAFADPEDANKLLLASVQELRERTVVPSKLIERWLSTRQRGLEDEGDLDNLSALLTGTLFVEFSYFPNAWREEYDLAKRCIRRLLEKLPESELGLPSRMKSDDVTCRRSLGDVVVSTKLFAGINSQFWSELEQRFKLDTEKAQEFAHFGSVEFLLDESLIVECRPFEFHQALHKEAKRLDIEPEFKKSSFLQRVKKSIFGWV